LKESKFPKKKKVWIIAGSVALVAVLVVWLAYSVIPHTIFAGLTNYYMPNYAKDTAKPLEKALLQAGAKKVCENATNGRDPDNTEPSYNAYYQFSVGSEEAVHTLQRVTKENGYELRPTPSDDKTVQDFEDRTSKDSTYTDLKPGKVELVASVYSDTTNKQLAYCGGKGFQGDATHTGVVLALRLPSFK